jgi:hypothetical protein
MTQDILGSREKAQQGRGQNQDGTGSSTRAKQLPIIPNVAPPNASADAGSWQTRVVTSEQKVPTTFGHRDRNANPAKVPGSK